MQLGGPAARASTSGGSTATPPPDSPVLQEQPPLSPVTCAVVTDPETTVIQRWDSLDHLELIASRHGFAGGLSAAEEYAQQDGQQKVGRHLTAINSPVAAAVTSQPAASSAEDGDTAAKRERRSGGDRRDTDASIGAENTILRQELSRLRAEHVTTRIQCVFLG